MARISLFASTLSQATNPGPVLEDQRFLLSSRPALELALSGQNLFPCCELLDEHKANRPPVLRVGRNLAGVMLGDSVIQIIRVPGVIGVVDAAEHIRVERHCSVTDRDEGLRQAQSERG